jgi:hypothetical protein
MSRDVVLTAGQPENSSAVVVMVDMAAAADTDKGKCILLCAPLAARAHRYPSSHEAAGQCTALTAIPKSGGRDNGKQLASGTPSI